MTTTLPMPAEVFSPGSYLADELEARDWTITEFASIIGRPTQAVSEILNGRKEITPRTATEIAAATGTEPATWLRLQDAYNLWLLSNDATATQTQTVIARRARLSEIVPMPELIRRGIVPATGIDAQEEAVRTLLGVTTLDDEPDFAMAARRSNQTQALTPPQVAWLGCVRSVRPLAVPFDRDAFGVLCASLTRDLRDPARLATLPAEFEAVGVHLVHVDRFDGSKIDGAAVVTEGNPVIALSGRISSLDSILFTLLHECAHVFLGHTGTVVDSDTHDRGDPREVEADALAGHWALPEPLQLSAPFTRAKVEECARRIGVHPAVVVGRLHHDGALAWKQHNGLIPRVRGFLTDW